MIDPDLGYCIECQRRDKCACRHEATPPEPSSIEEPQTDSRQSERDRLLANVRSGTWLDAQEFPELEYAIPGVIPEGFTVLAGAPKVGKSWFILSLCLALSSGGRALSALKVEPSTVLYLALEDGDRRLQDRIRQLLPGEVIPARFHYVTRTKPNEIVALIRAWLEEHPETRLVVLDTLGKVMPPAKQGETTYQRDYRVGSAIKAIADEHPGLAFVVVHHDRKAETGDFVDAVSGTNGIAGSADTIVLLARDRLAETAILNVTGRDVLESEYGLNRTPTGSWSLTGGNLENAQQAAREAREAVKLDKHGDRMRDTVRAVNEHPDGLTPKQLDALLGTQGQAKVYLARAVAAGLIDSTTRGIYLPLTPPVTSVTVLPNTNSPHENDSESGNSIGNNLLPRLDELVTGNTSNTPPLPVTQSNVLPIERKASNE